MPSFDGLRQRRVDLAVWPQFHQPRINRFVAAHHQDDRSDRTKTVIVAEIRKNMIRFYVLTFTMRLMTNMPITIMTPATVTIVWPTGSSNSTLP